MSNLDLETTSKKMMRISRVQHLVMLQRVLLHLVAQQEDLEVVVDYSEIKMETHLSLLQISLVNKQKLNQLNNRIFLASNQRQKRKLPRACLASNQE